MDLDFCSILPFLELVQILFFRWPLTKYVRLEVFFFNKYNHIYPKFLEVTGLILECFLYILVFYQVPALREKSQLDVNNEPLIKKNEITINKSYCKYLVLLRLLLNLVKTLIFYCQRSHVSYGTLQLFYLDKVQQKLVVH